MGCRCKERQQALTRAAKAIVTEDAATVKKELAFVAASMVQDTNSAFRASVQAAKARLSRR